MPESYKLTSTETVIVRRSEPSVIEVEGVWGPGGSPPPKHFHPDQNEEFRVLQGTLTAKVDGSEHVLEQGDVLTIPRGATHQMWNAGDVEARASWKTTPALRTEEWWKAIDELNREGEPGPLDFGAVLAEYDDVFRLALAPQLVGKPLVSAQAFVGRARRR